MTTRTLRLARPLDLRATVGHLGTGRSDPSFRLVPGAMARASLTPDGPVTLRVDVDAATAKVTAAAAGPGRQWALDNVASLLGCDDDLTGFDPDRHEVVARLARRLPGLRIGRTGLVADRLAATILAQKVTGIEAKRSLHRLVRMADQPAPRAATMPELLLPPSAAFLVALPSWRYTAAGVDRTRAATVVAAHRRIDRLQEAAAMDPPAAMARLTAIRGIGPWTAAIVAREALGDADAVEVGDFHLPNLVAWNLVRQDRADDARMLELLAPFEGHRGRVVRILELGGSRPPAYGPRLAPRRFGARTTPPKGR